MPPPASPPKVLLFGTGAVGTIYLHVLLQAKCTVTAVCRSNYTAAKQHGFHISSALYGTSIHIPPESLTITNTVPSTTTDDNKPFDYILISTKVLPSTTPTTAQLIAPAVTKNHTTLVLLQNGIAIEDPYAHHFPTNPLLSCVAYIPTTQTSPGHVTHGDINKLELGHHPRSECTPTAERLVSTLRAGGADASYVPNIQERRWNKLLLNAAWNPICALTLSRDVAFLASTPDFAENVIMGVLKEVVTLAQAQGFESVTMEAAEEQYKAIIKPRIGTAGIEPSMLVDVLWNRRMEVEVILGNPLRVAKKLGIEVPRLEMLYALIKGLDESMRWRESGKSLTGDCKKDG